MQVLSISNINHITYDTNFKAAKSQIQNIGHLQSKTSYMIQDFLHAYEEIKQILSRKTEAGIKKIAQYYPDVTLGENLIFHNCGEDRNSISIRVADSEQNRGLIYLARRKGNTESTKKVILNGFMLDGCYRLVSNFKPNYSKYFPKEKEYISQETIDELHLEEDLQKVFNDLEPMLLNFRKFLAKNVDSDLKLPDGKMNYSQIYEIKEAFRICKGIDEQTKNMSHKRYLAMNNDFNGYKNVTGLKSYMFKNLGEQKLSINFSEFQDKRGYNLKRLYVYDKEGNLIKLYSIIDNEKFATNINPNTPSVLPDKYTYANNEELETKYFPEFQKYFKLYFDKLKEYQTHVNKTIDSFFKQEINGEFEIKTSSIISEALDWYNLSKIKLLKLSKPVSNSIRTEVQGLEPVMGKTGLWLKNDEQNKLIQFLPINNKLHKNLIRITITDIQTAEKKDVLIHNFKHIVKNYNPQYPTIIPKFLKYSSQKEIEESNLETTFRYIKNKAEELASKADEAYESREVLARELDEQRKLKRAQKETELKAEAEKHKELKTDCRKMLTEALNNLDLGIENFNKAMKELQNKVAEFYNSQIQNKNN